MTKINFHWLIDKQLAWARLRFYSFIFFFCHGLWASTVPLLCCRGPRVQLHLKLGPRASLFQYLVSEIEHLLNYSAHGSSFSVFTVTLLPHSFFLVTLLFDLVFIWFAVPLLNSLHYWPCMTCCHHCHVFIGTLQLMLKKVLIRGSSPRRIYVHYVLVGLAFWINQKCFCCRGTH